MFYTRHHLFLNCANDCQAIENQQSTHLFIKLCLFF